MIVVSLTVAVAVGQGGLLGVMLLVGLASGVVVAEGLGRRLGGHTGDSYGACVVWTATLMLVLLALLQPLAVSLAR